MTSNPSNERRNRSSTGPVPSLSQLGREEEPLLLPIPPNSTIDDITRLVREAGANRIELLVPDGTTALQSIAGNEALREATKAAGVRVTLYTSDEKTTHAARFAKMDVVGIGGGSVAAPRPGNQPRRPTGQQRAVQPQVPPVTPRAPQPPQGASTQAAAPQPPRGQTPAQGGQRGGASNTAPSEDAALLQRLDTWEQAPQAQAPEPPARVRQSDEGALLYDVSGDIGVPRPADNDTEWNTFAQAAGRRPVADDQAFDIVQEQPRRQRRTTAADDTAPRAPRPSLLGALFGFMPQRSVRRPAAPDAAVEDDSGLRMSRPERTPEEAAARRRQSRSLTWLPLLAIAFLFIAGTGLFLWSQQGSGSLQNAVSRLTGTTAPLNIEPPFNATEALTRTGLVVPLVTEPVSDPNSINVQGMLISAPVTVTLQGTVEKTAITPIGFARGTIAFSNRSSGPISVPAGTPVQIGGKQFTLDSDVTVPAAQSDFSGTRNGVAEVTVTATIPGAQGNVGADQDVFVPGFSGNQGPLFVRIVGAFQGGTDQEVPIVSPDDVNKLLPDALSQLYGQGVRAVQNRVQELPGFVLIASAETPEISPTRELLKQEVGLESLRVFPPIGQVATGDLNGKFTLQMSRRFEALASPTDQPIDAQIQRAAASLLRREGRDVQTAEVEIIGWRRGDEGLLVDVQVVPRTGYLRVPAEREREIEEQLRGKPRAEAEQYLADLKAQGQIGDFTLPQEWTTVPDDLDITFEPPVSPSSAP